MLSYSHIPEFSKTAASSTFGRNILWKMSDFFRTKNGFKKVKLIELIRHEIKRQTSLLLALILNWN